MDTVNRYKIWVTIIPVREDRENEEKLYLKTNERRAQQSTSSKNTQKSPNYTKPHHCETAENKIHKIKRNERQRYIFKSS